MQSLILLGANAILGISEVMYFVSENPMTCACLQSPNDAADVLAAHGDHKGAAELLEERLLPAWFPEAPLSQALKPAEQQRLSYRKHNPSQDRNAGAGSMQSCKRHWPASRARCNCTDGHITRMRQFTA